MKPRLTRIGALMMLALGFLATEASAQGEPPQPRWSVEAAVGVQLDYVGTIVSAAFGFAPTRSITVLVSACAFRSTVAWTRSPTGG